MKIIALIFLFLPFIAHADCDGLIGFLNQEHPGRILGQTFGYTLDRLVVFEKEKSKPGSSISVVECINGKYKTQKIFHFDVNTIADLQFDETEGTVIVIFSIDPPETGYIENVIMNIYSLMACTNGERELISQRN